MSRAQRFHERIRLLREFARSERRLPSYAEMMTMFRVRSKNTVFAVVARMVEGGYLKRGPGGKLAPTGRLNGSVRLLGAVAAGFPSPAEEELRDTLSLDEFLIRRPEATFMLTVTGDSMIDAGIHPGDIVLLERGATPKSGDVVVAQVDDEWTLKYYRKDKDGVRLDPANRKYPVIRPRRSLELGGVVRAVIRKYA
ncbi:MAG: repressor LexA [Kiritimatiellae bacterium]|nr:repressor LexA [Kiritimatiellia bacterium]